MLSVIDSCQSSPCLNGGTCSNAINNFLCFCNAGYVGHQCQTGKAISNYSVSIRVLGKKS